MIFSRAKLRERESKHASSHKGFTLIELLVVVAIIAILSVVVILTLNPAALMQQSRDSNRVSDMSTLNSAISIYLSAGGNSLGNINTVYVSIPDPTATSTAGDQCQGLGLPTLPSTYSYHCAATSTVRSTDSTGWIPINFATVAIGSSLSQLPLDPTNQSSSRLYYTYTTNGTQFETTAAMESAKYQVGGSNDVISGDGGTLASVYEKGSKLGLEPLDYGDTSIIAYWPLTEGTGSSTYDWSGNGNTGTWGGTPTGTSGYYSPGKIGPWAGAFDGSTDYVSLGNEIAITTLSFWLNPSVFMSKAIVSDSIAGTTIQGYGGSSVWQVYDGTGTHLFSQGATLNQWHYYVFVYDGIHYNLYIDGAYQGQVTANRINMNFIGRNITYPADGLIDDVRVYNRALSASEIAAMYNGGK